MANCVVLILASYVVLYHAHIDYGLFCWAVKLTLLLGMIQLSVCRTRTPSISCDEEEESDKEHNFDDKKNRKLQQYCDQGCFTGRHETRLTRLLGEWFSHCKTASAGKRRVECPSRMTTGFMGGFKKFIQRCGEKCYPRKTLFSKRYLVE